MKTNLLNKKDGFTLVEVIISIAVLSLISVIVLRLFVLSNEVSEKVRIEDVAGVYASNVLEICKSAPSVKDIRENPFFDKANSIGDDGLVYVLHYNEKWQQTEQDAVFELTLKILDKDKGTSLSQNLSDTSHIMFKTALYDLVVTVKQLDPVSGAYGLIASYQSSKYFAFEE